MAGNNAIQILRSNTSTIAKSSEVLLIGQPLYDTETRLLYVGNGENSASELMYSAGGIVASGVRATGGEARIFGSTVNITATTTLNTNAPLGINICSSNGNISVISLNGNANIESNNIMLLADRNVAINSSSINVNAGSMNLGSTANRIAYIQGYFQYGNISVLRNAPIIVMSKDSASLGLSLESGNANIYSTNEIKINAPTVRLNANLITVNSSNISLQSSNIIQIFATNSTTIGGEGDVNIGGAGNVNVSAAAGTLSFLSFGDTKFNVDGGTIKLPQRVSGTIALTSDIQPNYYTHYVRMIGDVGSTSIDLTFWYQGTSNSTTTILGSIAAQLYEVMGGMPVPCTGRVTPSGQSQTGAYSIYAHTMTSLQYYTISGYVGNITGDPKSLSISHYVYNPVKTY